MKPISSNVVFHVSKLEPAIAFYKEKLGFQLDFQFGEPPSYAGLSLGNAYLHLSSAYPYKNNTGHGNFYLIYENVDNLYKKLLNQEVEFFSPIGDRDYGMRDFAIKDLDGNQIGIGAQI